MGFNNFRISLIVRVALLFVSIYFFIHLLYLDARYVSLILIGAIILFQLFDIIRYVEKTNRKLTRFLESIKYSDFSSGFAYDNKLGWSFRELNRSFNEVLEAFRQARAEKEEHLNYLHTIVQHVSTGLISFDVEGNIGLINNTAKRFLQAPQIHNIAELKPINPEIFRQLVELKPGHKALIRKSSDVSLAMHATELRLRGNNFKLVALQNIEAELQQKEIEAWQNLTRVLRHEIMNSITPIASLTETLNQILQEDLEKKNGGFYIEQESIEDLSDGLVTIENRSKGLIRFVDAYRDYTSIPKPKFTTVPIKKMFNHINNLLRAEMESLGIEFNLSLTPENLEIIADRELIEMVLINLIKNAREAIIGSSEPKLELRGRLDSEMRVIIEVKDNGPGIIPEALNRIFIPFYTTKKNGSGIGLALSRQIMQMHNGSLFVKSEPEIYTIFTLQF
jgi:two-component system, NtrC family, nitrogen regulation sensor histidine kinase NtrY